MELLDGNFEGHLMPGSVLQHMALVRVGCDGVVTAT